MAGQHQDRLRSPYSDISEDHWDEIFNNSPFRRRAEKNVEKNRYKRSSCKEKVRK